MAHRNTTKHLAYTISFNLSEVPEWVRKYKNGGLKTWKKRIKTNSCGQIILCNIYCSTTAILKFDFVYRQSKKYHPQAYVEECKYIDTKTSQYSMLNPVETV